MASTASVVATSDSFPLSDLWSIQESLLQSYRSTFITAESVVFGLAASVATTAPWPLVTAFLVLGVGLTVPWTQICGARARSVSFVHWLILRAESGQQESRPFHAFKEFQDTGRYDPLVLDADPVFMKLSHSRTRWWMEKVLPTSFLILWFFLAIYVAFLRPAA
ncbi:hypothetical protein BH09GEM1_BH09GEM1_46060 [soil metagenome]